MGFMDKMKNFFGMNKKGQNLTGILGSLLGISITLVVVGLVVAYGAQITGDVKGDMTVNSAEYNATASSLEGIGNLADKQPTLATIAVAVVIILLLIAGFGGFMATRQ